MIYRCYELCHHFDLRNIQASKMIHSYENLNVHQYEMSTPFNSTLVRIPHPPCWGIAICSLICPGNAKHTVGSAWLCRMKNMQDSLPTGHQGVNLLMVWPHLMGKDETVMWSGVDVASQSSRLGSTALASPSPCRGSQRWQAHSMRQSQEISVSDGALHQNTCGLCSHRGGIWARPLPHTSEYSPVFTPSKWIKSPIQPKVVVKITWRRLIIIMFRLRGLVSILA